MKTSKHCPKCGESKPYGEFSRQKKSKDGFQCYCKTCSKASTNESYHKHAGVQDCACVTCAARVNAAKGLKLCPKCNSLIPFEDFTKNRASSNGFGVYCKACAGENQANVRLTAINAWEHVADCACKICAIRAVGQPKKCSKCKILKPPDGFDISKGAIDGLQSWCKECLSDLGKREGRWMTRKRKYGVDKERFWDMFNSQDGRCAICSTSVAESRMEVDHDHSCCGGTSSCGECVRGLLCHSCNLALGLLKDDPNRVMALASYLMRFENVLGDVLCQ